MERERATSGRAAAKGTSAASRVWEGVALRRSGAAVQATRAPLPYRRAGSVAPDPGPNVLARASVAEDPRQTPADRLQRMFWSRRPPQQDIYRKVFGRSLDLNLIEQALRAAWTGWTKGTSLEFAGSSVTVAIPAEEPRAGSRPSRAPSTRAR